MIAPAETSCPCCGGDSARHRRGRVGASRQGAGEAARHRHAAAEVRLPGLREDRGRRTAGVIQAPAPRASSRAACRPRRSSPTCSSRNMPITYRSIVRRRSWRAKACTSDRSTLAHWVGFAAFELGAAARAPGRDAEGFQEALCRRDAMPGARSRPRQDENRLPLGDCARRPAMGRRDPPAVAYLYAPGRGAEHAVRHLAGFTGVLQVDGYAGYDKLTDPAAIRRSADARLLLVPLPPPLLRDRQGRQRADRHRGAARIGALYAIEADDPRSLRGRRRRATRKLARGRLIDAMKPWLEEHWAASPADRRSPRRSAMACIAGTASAAYLDDGRIEIDTNVVERSIRPIALSRKNALFAGSDEGGANWAIIASLIETAKLNGVNPHAWLTDTLTKLVNAGRHPASTS